MQRLVGSNPITCSMSKLKLEILEANYWEHYKFLKDISMFYEINHPKRVALEKEISLMIQEINRLKTHA